MSKIKLEDLKEKDEENYELHNIKMEEEELLWLQKLDMNRLAFKRQLVKRLTSSAYRLDLIGDDKGQLRDKNSTLLAEVEWILLGRYTKGSNITWEWPMSFVDSDHSVINGILASWPEERKELTKGLISTSSPMLISYISALLTDKLGLEYIYALENDCCYYAFGLRNIQWSGSEGDLEIKFKKELENLANEKKKEFNDSLESILRNYELLTI
jgi:hypothetical protein